MKVGIFGATGPTGQLIVETALARGHHVTALARDPLKLRALHANLTVVKGDVSDPSRVAEAVGGQDAVISSLGAPYGFKPITVYSTGASNIIAAMRATGARRLVTITSGGTFPGRHPESPFFFERILKPLFHTLYDDMRQMEEIVMASGLDWTILRPARLTNALDTGGPRLARDAYLIPELTATARRDLATVAVDQLERPDLIGAAAAVASEPSGAKH